MNRRWARKALACLAPAALPLLSPPAWPASHGKTALVDHSPLLGPQARKADLKAYALAVWQVLVPQVETAMRESLQRRLQDFLAIKKEDIPSAATLNSWDLSGK